MKKPKDYALSTVQDWVCAELEYKGTKAKIAKGSSEKALEWWSEEGFLKFGALREDSSNAVSKDARDECRAYVRANYRYGNPLFGFIFAIIIQVVISAIASIIVDWLFSDSEGAVYYGKIYESEAAE